MPLDKTTRLSIIRQLAMARHMVTALPGLMGVSHSEIAQEFSSLRVNHSAPMEMAETTSDDSEGLPMGDAIAAHHLGIS